MAYHPEVCGRGVWVNVRSDRSPFSIQHQATADRCRSDVRSSSIATCASCAQALHVVSRTVMGWCLPEEARSSIVERATARSEASAAEHSSAETRHDGSRISDVLVPLAEPPRLGWARRGGAGAVPGAAGHDRRRMCLGCHSSAGIGQNITRLGRRFPGVCQACDGSD